MRLLTIGIRWSDFNKGLKERAEREGFGRKGRELGRYLGERVKWGGLDVYRMVIEAWEVMKVGEKEEGG